MFFQKKSDHIEGNTTIPNVIFHELFPIADPLYLKVYLYGYYLSTDHEQHHSNEDIATRLNISMDDIFNTWDFFEGMDLIRKHYDNPYGATDSYSVEFLKINPSIFPDKPSQLEELEDASDQIRKENSEYRRMFQEMERILGIPFSPNDVRTVNDALRRWNISKDLLIEAVQYCVVQKKIKSLTYILKVAENWHSRGIKTSDDLNAYFSQRDRRYHDYKTILRYLGEYRTPTEAEKQMMDTWLDEYYFDISVIQSAIQKTTAIKSPNLNYINGILKNWHEKTKDISKYKIKQSEEKDDPITFRLALLDLLSLGDHSLTETDYERLEFIYQNYGIGDVELAIAHLESENTEPTLSNLVSLFQEPQNTKIDRAEASFPRTAERITSEHISEVITKKTVPKQNAARSEEELLLEQRILNKRKSME